MSIDITRPLGPVHDFKTVNTWTSFLPDLSNITMTTNPFSYDPSILVNGYNAHDNEDVEKLFEVSSKLFLVKIKQPIDCCLEAKVESSGCVPKKTKELNRIFLDE